LPVKAYVLSTLFKAFIRYRCYNICPDERMNAADGQPENIMPSPTLSGSEGITKWFVTRWKIMKACRWKRMLSRNGLRTYLLTDFMARCRCIRPVYQERPPSAPFTVAKYDMCNDVCMIRGRGRHTRNCSSGSHNIQLQAAVEMCCARFEITTSVIGWRW